MPRFYFDIFDGERLDRDEFGLEISNLETAQAQAVCALPEVVREVLPDGKHREISVLLRSEAGKSLFRASLTLRCISLISDSTRPERH